MLACPGRDRRQREGVDWDGGQSGLRRREASGCENCRLSSHPPPRSGRNLSLLVRSTMVSYVFLALLGTNPLLSRVAHDAPISGASGARDGYDALLTPH